jgi:hypothetical protein
VTSQTVFKSKRGGFEESVNVDCTEDFNSAISRESKKQSSTRLVSSDIFHEYSGLIFFTIAVTFFRTSSGMSVFQLNDVLFKSFIDHCITSGSFLFFVVLYQHKPER